MNQAGIFCFGCGIFLMIGVGMVLYVRAVRKEKDLMSKPDTNTSHYSIEESWWEANEQTKWETNK
jgi:hypothetical protein